jgi:hypothetical protein
MSAAPVQLKKIAVAVRVAASGGAAISACAFTGVLRCKTSPEL